MAMDIVGVMHIWIVTLSFTLACLFGGGSSWDSVSVVGMTFYPSSQAPLGRFNLSRFWAPSLGFDSIAYMCYHLQIRR